MHAVGVAHAGVLNLAARKYGVEQAILQALIDEFGGLMSLPEPAREFAQQYAANKGRATASNENGVLDPEANIMAAAWLLRSLFELHGKPWAAVADFFGEGPPAQARAHRIAQTTYLKYKRIW